MGQVIVGSGDMLFYGGAWNGTVDYYADLPDATTHEAQIWAVLNSSGIYGINYKSAGLYISNGTTWNIYSAFDSFQLSAVSPLSYNENTSTVSTSMSTNKLVGRYSVGSGVMQEIGLGTGLSFSGGNLTVNVSTALGFTPENVANKATDFSTINNTLYPSVEAVQEQLNDKQDQDNLLDSISNLAGNGIIVRNANDAETREIVAGSSKITVSNGSGVSGNPSIDLGTVAISDITNLQTTLDAKVPKVVMTDNAIVRANGTTGDIQGSLASVDDSGNLNSQTITGIDGVYSFGEIQVTMNPLVGGTVAPINAINLGLTNTNHAYNLKQVTPNGADAYDWWTDGTINYTAGLDGTDGKWKLSNAANLGTNDALEFNGINGKFYGTVNLNSLTASTTLVLDGSKNIVSIANTGTGNNVLANSPVLITPNIGAATGTSLTATGEVKGTSLKSEKSAAGSTVSISSLHTNNTDGASNAVISAITGGANGGDPVFQWSNQVAGSLVEALIDNSDNDIFKFQRNGTDFLTSTLAGAVDLPSQPMFAAIRSNNAVNVTGDGTQYLVGWNSEIFDVGNVFASNTFAAPITSNRYYFDVGLDLFGLTATHIIRIELVTTQYTYTLFRALTTQQSSQQIISASKMNVVMDAGDTAFIRLTVAGGTKVVDVLGDATTAIRSYFSGGLL